MLCFVNAKYEVKMKYKVLLLHACTAEGNPSKNQLEKLEAARSAYLWLP